MSVVVGIGAEEYLAGEWDRYSQLVGGEVVVTDPRLWHQELVVRLSEALRAWCRTPAGRGRAGIGGNWVLGPGEVYCPDVWWVADPDRLDLHAVGNDGGPDLVIECDRRAPGTSTSAPSARCTRPRASPSCGWWTARRRRSW